jgi:asparagine synthase (glutamine-hydrolysing)
MCGIAGVLFRDPPAPGRVEALLQALGGAIVHRGPDDHGTFVHGPFGAASRRLSIVDVAGGHQPIHGRDPGVGIVYNGETYNYQELRAELVARGHRFRTASDTEVVLRLYEERGEDAFERLEGMFAFCLWDLGRRVAYLVRDAFGMKPLYVYRDAERLTFCSELTPLLGLPGTDRALDPAGLADYLTFRYVNAPYTLYRRIERLPAGCFMRVPLDGGPPVVRSYCDLADLPPEPPGPPAEAAERLRAWLRQSVRDHLSGEVPIALLLSGGLDSSIIAALLHELDVNLEAFNVGFAAVNEFEYSGAVAQACGIKVHHVVIDPGDIIRRLDEVIRALDEPLADPAAFALYFLCERVRQHAKVVLSGEGADELFAGYPQYRLHREEPGAPDFLERWARASHYFPDQEEVARPGWRSSRWRRTAKYLTGPTPLAALATFDLKTWLPEDLMMKADKILMRHSLEGRFPYLQRRLWRLALGLPDAWKLDGAGVGKRLLRDTFRPLLPARVFERPKMGFTVPTLAVLQAAGPELPGLARALRGHEVAEYVDLGQVERLWARALGGDGARILRAWTLFVLLRWLRQAEPVPAG